MICFFSSLNFFFNYRFIDLNQFPLKAILLRNGKIQRQMIKVKKVEKWVVVFKLMEKSSL